MKIVGLITEYNPFHNGHLYHIKKAKELTEADAVLVVMSGDFVQRGAPALMPKHLRAQIALENGAGLVLELPVCYATGSAEYFAEGAITLLDQLGCVTSLCFGSECGDYPLLERIARILCEEPYEYSALLKDALRRGMTFPQARQSALSAYLQDPSIDQVLADPNNILGIEYIKALYRHKSNIKGYTIQRKVSGYHDTHLSGRFSSASAIRNLFASDNEQITDPALFHQLSTQMPVSAVSLLKETYRLRYPVYANDLSLLLKYRLMTEDSESLTNYLDLTEDLKNRILNHIDELITFEQFCDLLKSKELTYTRISRSLLHILLGIKYADMQKYRRNGGCQYAHVLGFRKDQTDILKIIKQHTKIPLLTKLSRTGELSDIGYRMLQTDIMASDLYESIITDKYGTSFINEHRKQVLRME